MREGHTATAMSDNPAIIATQANATASEIGPNGEEIIETRFGKIAIKRDHPILFPQGLLGMPDNVRFCLLEFPVKKFPQFRLLQSLEDNALSFITLPVEVNNSIVERDDIEKACKDLGIPVKDLAILLIVSVHRGASEVRLSVNARAPLLIDANRREATQYVFQNNRYLVQQPLPLVEQGS